MFPAADGGILQRSDRLFCGIDHLQVFDPPLAAFSTHHPGEGADGSLVNIRNPERGGIQFVSGSHSADNRRSGCFGLFDQGQFSFYGVNRVYYIVVLCETFV